MKKLKLEELNRPGVEEYKKSSKLPVVVVLDNIRSGMNVGSVFRTVDAFAFEKIYVCGISARPPHREILKTAIGASDSVEWTYLSSINDCIDILKNEGYEIIGIEQTNESIELQNFQINHASKYAIVFGNEVNGISDEILDKLDRVIEIPQFGTKHSLNISVCAGIVIWRFWEKLNRS